MSSPKNADRRAAAELVATALIEAAARLGQHRRLYLSGHVGLRPDEIFTALARKLNRRQEVRVTNRAGAVTILHAIDVAGPRQAGGLLVPYLVGAPGPNSGTAGFAALLRDEVPQGSQPRILLVLDQHPVETVRTAAQDAAELDSLAWEELAVSAIRNAAAEVRPVLEAVLDADKTSNPLPRTAHTLGELIRLASVRTADEAGRGLYALGQYVSLANPGTGATLKRRLKRAAQWRAALQTLSAPDQDLLSKLRPRYTAADDPRLQAVMTARTPFGLDYSRFTLDDLPGEATTTRPARFSSPLRARGAGIASVAGRGAVWLPGGGQFSLILAARATDDQTATVRWADGTTEELPITAGSNELPIRSTGDRWRYAVVRLPAGDTAELAIFHDPGSWAPFEADLDIDAEAGAFRCGGAPQVLAMAASGAVLGQVSLDHRVREDGEVDTVNGAFASQSREIELLVTRLGDEDDGAGDDEPPDGRTSIDGGSDPVPAAGSRPEAGSSNEDDDGHPGALGPFSPQNEYGDDDSGDSRPHAGESPSGPSYQLREFPSVPHARLHFGRQAQPDGPPGFLLTQRTMEDGKARTELRIWTNPGYSLLSNPELAPGLDGLAIEREALAQPEKLAFAVIRKAGRISLGRHPHFGALDLTGLPDQEFAAFLTARARLFAILHAAGSVHALGAGTGTAEAVTYVRAYQELLKALVHTGRFLAEYEAIALCDSVTDAETGNWWIASTSPVAIAYLLELTRQAELWLPDAAQLLPADLASCTLRHLMPTFESQGFWYESSAQLTPLLWRRYARQIQASGGEQRPGYIARRVSHFLDVHPEYQDERQSLALAFVEPGDGTVIVDALRRVVRPVTSGLGAGQQIPCLDITIVSSSDTPTALESVVTGTAATPGGFTQLDRALRDRVTINRVAGSGELGFQHITFVFQSTLVKESAVVDLDSRAGTLFAEGLASAPGRHTDPGKNETVFYWGTFAPPSTSLLGSTVRCALELVGGMPRDPLLAGHTKMPSTRIGRLWLDELYDSSAWVVHLDKLLGLEAFTPVTSGAKPRFLIDYEDRADPGQHGLDAITATARVAPYKLAIRQALKDLGDPVEAALDRVLRLFNGVSGKWALGLVAPNGTRLAERIGLAAAIASLEDLDGAPRPDSDIALVIPLEELIEAIPAAARPAGARCDDLLYVLVQSSPGTPRLRGRLLEIKYRGAADGQAAMRGREQLERTCGWLLDTFTGDGPGKLFRARDLSETLRAAATRSAAFDLVAIKDRPGFEAALDHVARGDFTLDLAYEAGGHRLMGDFISIEPDSQVGAHRQPLPGSGLPLGHVRLGGPALRALAAGRAIPKPPGWPVIAFPDTDGLGRPAEEVGTPRDQSRLPLPPEAPADRPASAEQSGAQVVPPAELTLMAERLDSAFGKYGLAVEPFLPGLAQIGPSVIRYRTRTLGRLSIADIERRARDISREIAAHGEAQIGDEPGFITVDVPRAEPDRLLLTQVLPQLGTQPSKPGALDFIAGVAPSGETRVADLSRLPHLLVAGATGSGKSVFLRGLLVELLRARSPEQLQLLIIDPKRLDFAPFARAPHVRGNVIISDPDEALTALQDTLEAELAIRQPVLEAAGVSSAAEYYEAGGRLEDLPQLVILVDEFADLVLAGTDRKAFSELVQRYAQLTRAYGIFLVLATQRPSVDVITGSIKANLGARIAFSLPSARDSMTVLDRGGAEDLLGNGDLLFYRGGRVERLQAPFASLQDVRSALGTYDRS